MESVKEQITIHWVIYTRVIRIFEEPSGSWWVQFDGSWESLYFGEHKPFSAGDKVKITFEKIK
jgi:hypothetical protein